MKIYDDTTIFICSPGQYYTGGPQSLHELCSFLRKMQFNACMHYINHQSNPVHPELKKYHLPFSKRLVDSPHNIIILPETMLNLFRSIKKSRVVIWWMSVDNYFVLMAIYVQKIIRERNFLQPWRPPFPESNYQLAAAPSVPESNCQHPARIFQPPRR